jgi:hypothetical protein
MIYKTFNSKLFGNTASPSTVYIQYTNQRDRFMGKGRLILEHKGFTNYKKQLTFNTYSEARLIYQSLNLWS